MTALDQLKQYEANQLDGWYDLDDEDTEIFLQSIVEFANENQQAMKAYCTATLPSEFSSLSIVFEALSENSSDWNGFLMDEIVRVVRLAKDKKIKPEYLEVLEDIEMEDINVKNESAYTKALDFMTSNLQLNNTKKFNIHLLDIVDAFLVELEDGDPLLRSSRWIEPILKLANEAQLSVRLKAHEVLEDTGAEKKLIPISFMDKIKGVFS